MRFHLTLLTLLAFSTALLAQVQEKPVEIDRLQAKVSLRVPSATTPPAADCDAVAELGNIVIDTNDGSTGMVWICAGQAAGWIPMNLMRRVTAPESTALPGFMELILPTTGENDCEGRVALRLFGATQCLATLSDLTGLGGGGSDTDAIHDNVSGEIAAIAEKALPVAADLLIIEDSAASNAKKRAQAGKLSLDGGDSGAGTTRPSPSNIIGLRSHNTDCTTLTDGKAREICCDEDDGACFVCVPSAGDCDTAGEWKRRDDTGAGGGDPVLISGNAVADASGVDLLGSGVIVVTFNGAVSPDTGTWSFAPANLTGTTTWGGGAGQTWAWDAGATDPTFTFASNALTITNVATVTAPGFTSTGTAPGSIVLTEADPGTSTVTHSVDGDIASSISYKWPVATSGYHKWTVAAGVATATFNATIPLADGGTNQTAWTASRCVQVNAGGTALESAGAACGSGGSGDNIRVEDGDNAGTFTAMSDADFDDSGDINFTRAAGPPDVLTATVRANAVAMPGDTTGNYLASCTNGTGMTGCPAAAEDASYAPAFDFSDAGADPALGAEECRFSSEGASAGGWICEGATADLIETRFRVTDPTSADRIVTIPDADSVTCQAQTCTGTDKFSALSGTTGALTCSTDDDVPESGDFGGLTGGAGITNTAGTLATASGETDFLASGALTCTTAQQGRMQVHTTPLQYCDNAATPALQYAAYATSAGAATSISLTSDPGNCTAGNHADGIDGAGVAQCSVDDDVPEAADYSALTAGRSLTAPSAGTIDADAELYTDTKCINIDPAATTTDWFFYRTDAAITVTGIDCIVDAATSAVLTLRECDANGGTCGATEAAITCATTNTTEAAGIDDAAVDAGDWMRVLRGTVTGSPAQATLCMTFTKND